MDARLKAKPDLKLLLDLEPAHRVFVANLTDALSRRSAPALATTTKPGPFWTDVFVDASLPWGAFLESMLWHIAVVSVLWTVGQTWIKQEQIQQRRNYERSRLTYFPPPKKFPALGGRGPQVRQHPRPTEASKSAVRVSPEKNSVAMKPPDLKLAQNKPNLMASTSSAMPLFAPRLTQTRVPTAPSSALAPATNVSAAIARRLDLPQNAAIAPSTNVGSISGRRTMASPNSAAVPPTPNLKASTGKTSGANLGNPMVVAPAPRLTAQDQDGIVGRSNASVMRPVVVVPTASANGSGVLGSRGGMSSAQLPVVAPTPSLNGTGPSSGGRNLGFARGAGVVSPAPSLKAGSSLASGGRSSSLSGPGAQVVAPPASLGPGSLSGASRGTSIAGLTNGVVPPTVSLGGGLSARRGANGVSSTEAHGVPPPPSATGSGSSSGSRSANALAESNQQALPPPAQVPDAGKPAPTANPAMDAKAVPPAPTIADASDPATIELPVRVIGLAMSLPNSSYFSNYEVFIAERRQKKGDPELIKLVYESLPYQPRLAEYGLDNSKVYKLRVTRDPACDESLLQITWPQTDEKHSGSKYATGPPALAPGDKNNLLPCYRTTADDYRRAITRDR